MNLEESRRLSLSRSISFLPSSLLRAPIHYRTPPPSATPSIVRIDLEPDEVPHLIGIGVPAYGHGSEDIDEGKPALFVIRQLELRFPLERYLRAELVFLFFLRFLALAVLLCVLQLNLVLGW